MRIFSFYRPPGVDVAATRDTVLRRLRAFADLAERERVVLVHENEKDIYGDVPARVLDLIESVGSPALRVAWDNANFVQVGVRPFSDGYAMCGRIWNTSRSRTPGSPTVRSCPPGRATASCCRR